MSQLTEGTFRAIAQGGELGKSKQKQTDQIAITFGIAEGQATGETVTAILYFTPATTPKTLETMKQLGWKGDFNDLSTLNGEADLVLKYEEWEGNSYLRVQWINRPGESGGGFRQQAMTDQDKKQFAARMRGAVAAAFGKAPPATTTRRAPAGRPAPRPAPPAQDDVGEQSADDDIPF